MRLPNGHNVAGSSPYAEVFVASESDVLSGIVDEGDGFGANVKSKSLNVCDTEDM